MLFRLASVTQGAAEVTAARRHPQLRLLLQPRHRPPYLADTRQATDPARAAATWTAVNSDCQGRAKLSLPSTRRACFMTS